MEKRKSEASDFVAISNIFVSVDDDTNLAGLLSAFEGNKILTTKSGRHLVQPKVSNLNNLFGMDQYNASFLSQEFEAFGQPAFIGVMYEKFNLQDQISLSSNKVQGAIDLIVVNFGGKSFQHLNRDEQAALFLLQSGINNFGRVTVLTDPDDYRDFVKYLNRPKNKGTTEMSLRLAYAQKAAKYLAQFFNDFAESRKDDQKWITITEASRLGSLQRV